MTPTPMQITILDKALLHGGTPTYNATLAEVALLKYKDGETDFLEVEAIAVALFYRRTFVSIDYAAPHFVKNMKPETIANWKARIATYREMTPERSELNLPPVPIDRDAMFSAWLNITDAAKMYQLALANLRRCSFEVYRTFPRKV